MSIASPCTKVCVLDGPSGLCIGCGRTAAEIGGWLSLGNRERIAIMATLKQRLAQHGLAPSPAISTRVAPAISRIRR